MIILCSVALTACGNGEDRVGHATDGGRLGVGAEGIAAFDRELRGNGLSESVARCVIGELDVGSATVKELQSPEFMQAARAAGEKCADR
jgi:hypothetical protein